MAKTVAVIDIGSNSARMVVYEKTSRFAFHLLHEAKSKVRISQNAYQNGGNLQEIPMQRTFDALSDFLNIAQSYKARKILCIATSALRDAPNKKIFINRVQKELGLNIKVIDGEKEAYYGGIACANLLANQENAMSVDIGGGSTEFSLINNKDVSNTLSLELGTVRLKELFFDKDDREGAIAYIDQQLHILDTLTPTTLIGIGGTFRAIATAIMNKTKHPLNKLNGFECDVTLFEEYLHNILDADALKLKKIGIDADRFDIIKPGALILQRILNKLSVQNLIASGVGVREGVYLCDLLRNSQHKFPQNYNPSLRYLLDSYLQDSSYSNQLSFVSKKIFDLTHEYLGIDPSLRFELGIAAKLYPIGTNIHFYSKNKHSYYLIQSALEYGYTHSQILVISTLARYAKRKLPSTTHLKYYKVLLPQSKTLKALSYMLSVAISLLSHRPKNVDFELSFEEGTLIVSSKSSMYLSKDALIKLDRIKELKVKFSS
ncbi:MAG: Ppx/GppA family phosphatase [Helicobacteraceae bacterium]|nr:Ppx/GppA family phosphatase [Helicobacteraceae bacterium]